MLILELSGTQKHFINKIKVNHRKTLQFIEYIKSGYLWFQMDWILFLLSLTHEILVCQTQIYNLEHPKTNNSSISNIKQRFKAID